MSNKNKKQRLLLHTYEAHPLACAGEVNKQFVIAMIALAAIVVLALLLLFSSQFVGKAIYSVPDTGGISLVSPKAQPVLKNQPVTLYVGAYIKGKTKIINFVLPLPPELTCSGVTVNNLTNAFQLIAGCKDNDKIIYEYYTLGIGNNLNALTGAQDLTEIKFSGAPAGEHVFEFETFTYFDIDSNKEVPLEAGSFSLKVAECKPEETLCNGNCVDLQKNKSNCGQCNIVCNLEKCVDGKCIEIKKCGNSVLDPGEECDSPPDNSGVFSTNCNGLGFNGGLIQCTKECKFDTSSCGAPLVLEEEVIEPIKGCGNNILDQGEECDSPPDNSGVFKKNCTGLGFNGGLIQCTNKCKFNTSSCGAPLVLKEELKGPIEECGNNVLDKGEKCDGINLGGKSCFDFDFDGGLLQCSIGCTSFNTSKCNPKPVQPVVDVGGVQAPAVDGAKAVNATVAAVPAGAVQQTKISLTDVAPLNNAYSTIITATEDFTTEITVYTVLYGANNKVLSIKLEKIEGGLKKGAAYTATLNYPLGGVKKKSVIVYDVELKPTIYGKL